MIKNCLIKELTRGIQLRDIGELYDMQYRIYRIIRMLKSSGSAGEILRFAKGIAEALERLLEHFKKERMS